VQHTHKIKKEKGGTPLRSLFISVDRAVNHIEITDPPAGGFLFEVIE